MQTFKSLQFLRLFKGLFEKFGIDYEAMQKILTIKLTMDQRRVPTIFNESKKKEGNQLFKSLWIYAIGDELYFSNEPCVRHDYIYHYDVNDFGFFNCPSRCAR
jgi:hypothetical protein